MTELRGAFPVLCTPFRDDGRIDEADFDALIDFVLEAGAHGCVYPGVASEVETLTPEERARMIARLSDRLAGRMPFVVGASDPEPARALARTGEGANAGAAAAMIMAPAHLGRDVAAQTAFFRPVAAGSALPIMLQNAPPPFGAGLAPEQVAAVAVAVEGIRFVKEETLPCGQNLTRILAAAGRGIDGVFGGAGGRYVTDELARGSLGTMPASELADIHVRLVDAWIAGNEAEARRLFMRSLPLLNFQAVFRMHMTKATLKRRGVIRNTAVRAKGPRLDAGDQKELDALLDQFAAEFRIRPAGAVAQATPAGTP